MAEVVQRTLHAATAHAADSLAGLGRVLFGAGSEGAAAVSGGSQGTANLSERVVNPVGHFVARMLERPGELLTEAPDAVFRPLFMAQGMAREARAVAAEAGMRGRRAAEYAKMFDLPIMDHCQDHSMTVGAVMNEGVMSTRLGLRGWPAAAEAGAGSNDLPRVAEPWHLQDCGWVANRWCELLPLPPQLKQQLMELDNPLLRLELVGDILARHGIAGD